VDKLKILLVTDEHEEWTMLDKLVKAAKSEKYDIVLMSGDQGNCNNVIGEKADEHFNKEAAKSYERYVTTLEKLAPKMFYIPGNHDAEVTFQEGYKAGKHAINLHLKSAELAPGLVILGMGGSKPTLLQPKGSTEWRMIYNPYPWKSEDHYKQALQKVWSEANTSQNQVILFTHDGPIDSPTTTYFCAEGTKRYGS
jgi:Icc-related predicted phosphoesterase